MFDVTLRMDSHGGGLTRELRGTAAAFKPRRYAILLVHGYNVDEDSAYSVYRKFKKKLVALSPRIDVDIGFVYWPGDGRVPLLRALKYPEKVGIAKLGSGQLAGYISRLRSFGNRSCQVVVIAHSLGCRLVLEALNKLSSKTNIIRIFLMAAAVPVKAVKNKGHLALALKETRQRSVFFSLDDKVLKRTFGVGQMAAKGERGIFPEAVGLRGRPERGVWTLREPMIGYGHSDYWDSQVIAQYVVNALFGTTPKPKPARSEPERRIITRLHAGLEGRAMFGRSVRR